MNANQKFIVWDWNGTVVADELAVLQALNKVLTYGNKAKITLEVFRELYDMPLTKFYGGVGFTADELKKHLPIMNNLFHQHFESATMESLVREGWGEIAAVHKTDNFSNIILSNHLVPSIKFHAERLNISSHFDYILAHANQTEQMSKLPKGERLRRHMKEQGLSVNNGIIIGDTPEEAHIGREAGMASVLITGGYASQKRLKAAQPDYLIHSLTELKPILREREFLS